MTLTIRTALDVRQRSVSYREAEVLLAHTLQCSREYLHQHPEQSLTTSQAQVYATYLDRREQNEPIAYITGVKEFYGRPFRCDQRALIPRPETEALIEYFLKWERQASPAVPSTILELGTGCGNIAITLALESKNHSILATDISSDALSLAQANWQALTSPSASTTLQFITANLFEHPEIKRQAPYASIVANLPYVSTTWQHDPAAQAEVIFYEPDIALFGGADGLDHYRAFFAAAPSYLHPQGAIFIEHGEDETAGITALAQAAFPQHRLCTHQDYAQLDRVLSILPVD